MLSFKQLLVFCIFISTVFAQEQPLISIKSPLSNQVLVPGRAVNIEYTVNTQSSSTTTPNYPLSMDVYFRWKKDQNLELRAISGLATQSIAGGSQTKTYRRNWKLPNCHFFKRYPSPEWTFTLEFEMKYGDAVLADKPSAHPLGPQQSNIVVPIQINATVSDDHHGNSGC